MRHTLILILAMTTAAESAGAQLVGTVIRSKTTGFQVSASGQYGALRFAGADRWHTGYGAVVTAGYGVNSTFTFLLTGALAEIEWSQGTFPLQQLDAAMRVNMAGSNWRWVPFLEIGLGPRKMTQQDFSICASSGCQEGELERSGMVWAQSFGVSFYPMRRLAVTTAFQWNEGAMDNVKFNGVESLLLQGDARSTRLSIGATWIVSGGGATR